MDTFEKKTHTTKRGYTYTYYFSPAIGNESKSIPALQFHHGWPDSAHLWEGIIKRLRQLSVKNAIIVPDLLGYGGTSKPIETSAYNYTGLTQDLIELIDVEGYEKVIAVGHDWGSAAAQRLYNYHPNRVAGIILLNLHYSISGDKFDLDATIEATKTMFGYPLFSYWYLFTAPDGPSILQNNISKLFTVMHGKDANIMKALFCEKGSMEAYFASANELEVRDYAKDPAFKQSFIDRMQRDGFEGPQNWYKAITSNLQSECDSQLPSRNYVANVPVLYIGCSEDAVCRPELGIPAKEAGLLPDLEESRMIEAAHWVPFEKPEEVASIIVDFLSRRLPF